MTPSPFAPTTAAGSAPQIAAEASTLMERILYEVKRVVVGQDRFLERVMIALLAQGHLLVEGVPGLAKTLTVRTLASTLRGSFRRIQFTPDLVPADLVGTRIWNQKTGEFSTSLGPVFANLLLADEINRAPAKVQSALLEVMQEHQVTIAGETHKVPSVSIGFCVAITTNGSGTLWLSPAIVTCRSCITSSSALCTLAGARLISSASSRLANTGPRLVPNSPLFWL